MPQQVTLTLLRAVVDTQSAPPQSANANHMISRVFFTLEIGDKQGGTFHVEVTQPRGSRYSEDPLEIGPMVPHFADEKFNWDKFREQIEKYYRQQVGPNGSGIRFGENAGIVMRDCVFSNKQVVHFPMAG